MQEQKQANKANRGPNATSNRFTTKHQQQLAQYLKEQGINSKPSGGDLIIKARDTPGLRNKITKAWLEAKIHNPKYAKPNPAQVQEATMLTELALPLTPKGIDVQNHYTTTKQGKAPAGYRIIFTTNQTIQATHPIRAFNPHKPA